MTLVELLRVLFGGVFGAILGVSALWIVFGRLTMVDFISILAVSHAGAVTSWWITQKRKAT